MKKSDWALVAAALAVLAFEVGPVLLDKFEKASVTPGAEEHGPSMIISEKPPPHDGPYRISSPQPK